MKSAEYKRFARAVRRHVKPLQEAKTPDEFQSLIAALVKQLMPLAGSKIHEVRGGTDGPSLWELATTPTPSVRSSSTSKGAAKLQKISQKAHDLRVVLSVIKSNPAGLTDEQIAERSGLPPNTARPRRVDLVDGGFLIDSGRKTPTASGRLAVVWIWTGKEDGPDDNSDTPAAAAAAAE